MKIIVPASDLRSQRYVDSKLKETEREEEQTNIRFSSKEVWQAMQEAIEEK